MTIRLTQRDDLPKLQTILDETGLFPGELLPDMIANFLDADQSRELWLTCEADGTVVGFCYAIAEKLTDGTWNMLAIAVDPLFQSRGHGATLVQELEATLRQRGQRILIVDTSGTDGFAQTREFYKARGYTQEARIRDFWAKGEDKITFWKSLA